MNRRSLLAVVGAGMGALAGCSTLGGNSRDAGDPRPTGSDRDAVATGTAAPPPLPYAGAAAGANLEGAHGIEVRNEGSRPTYVTVVVEDGDRTLYVDSRTIPPGGNARHEELIRRRGIYRVTLETEDGDRAGHDMVVGERWSKLIVRVGPDGIRTNQNAICDPGCPPVEATGQSVDLPIEDPTDPGPEVAGALSIRSARPDSTPVDVVVVGPSGPLLDYRYRLPAGVTLLVPVLRAIGTYGLSIRGGGGRLDTKWHVPEERFPAVRVGRGGPAPVCHRDRLRLTAIQNATDHDQRVTIRLLADGRTVATRTVGMPAGTSRQGLALEATGEELTLRAELASGRSMTGEWSLCPPGDLRLLVLDGFLYLRSDSRIVASDRS